MIKRMLYVWLLVAIGAFSLTSCLSRPEHVRPTYPIRSKSASSINNVLHKYADIIGVDPRDLRSAALYNYIDEWMGIPHRLGGQDKRGIDCSAFTNLLVADVYGKRLPRTANDMAESIKRKYENQLREGDLVFFKFDGKKVDHVGVYLHNNKFVHVSTSKGVIISDLQDPWYRKYFTRAGSIL